jgi:hypothetical protein
MKSGNRIITLITVLSVLVGPIVFIVSVSIGIYKYGLPNNYTWFSLLLDPWVLGFLSASLVFGCGAVWAICGVIWAVYAIISFKKYLKGGGTSKGAVTRTVMILSLLFGPIAFAAISVYDRCICNIPPPRHWFICGLGDFLYIYVLGFTFIWIVYGLTWAIYKTIGFAMKKIISCATRGSNDDHGAQEGKED